MQTAPTSFEIMATTQRQTLLADAERVRPKLPRAPRAERPNDERSPLRSSLGQCLIRLGERLAPAQAPVTLPSNV